MLGERIVDEVESRAGEVAGLGLLPVTTVFETAKLLGRRNAVDAESGHPISGYEIRHGRLTIAEHAHAAPFAADGVRVGAVAGTSWHGLLENDAFRRAYLTGVATAAGRAFTPAPDTSFAAIRARRLDALGDLVADHLDTDALRRLLDHGAPANLSFIPPGAP
jgi:adenosylcobyric acid synthase